MSFTTEEEVKGNSPYEEFAIAELSVDASIGFIYFGERTAKSKQWGEFTVWDGLMFDPSSKSEKEFLDSCELRSFIPNKVLKGKQANGAIIPGELYRIKKTWNKGDKFDDGTVAQAYGYTLYHLKVPTTLLEKAQKKHDELMPNAVVSEEEK